MKHFNTHKIYTQPKITSPHTSYELTSISGNNIQLLHLMKCLDFTLHSQEFFLNHYLNTFRHSTSKYELWRGYNLRSTTRRHFKMQRNISASVDRKKTSTAASNFRSEVCSFKTNILTCRKSFT